LTHLFSFAFFEVHIGALKLDEVEHGRVVVFAIDAIVHEDYNNLNVDNDIGLLKLSESVSGPSKIENMIIFVSILKIIF
jgi:hypothetical protein